MKNFGEEIVIFGFFSLASMLPSFNIRAIFSHQPQHSA